MKSIFTKARIFLLITFCVVAIYSIGCDEGILKELTLETYKGSEISLSDLKVKVEGLEEEGISDAVEELGEEDISELEELSNGGACGVSMDCKKWEYYEMGELGRRRQRECTYLESNCKKRTYWQVQCYIDGKGYGYCTTNPWRIF